MDNLADLAQMHRGQGKEKNLHRFHQILNLLSFSNRAHLAQALIIDAITFSIFLTFIVSSRLYWKPAIVFTLLSGLV